MIDVSSSPMVKTIDRHSGDLHCCYYHLAIGDFCLSISAIDSSDAHWKMNDNFLILFSKQQAGHQVLLVVLVIYESFNLN